MPTLEDDEWSTTERTLAVWLAYCEHSYVLVVERHKAYWVFKNSDDLQEAVRMFRENEAGADPSSIIETFLRMRREMFARLDAERAAG